MKPGDIEPSLLAAARLRPLLACLQLASPALPVGGFAYSQGLEAAIEAGVVRNATTARRWISDFLVLGLARFEAPLWLHLFDAWRDGAHDRFSQLNDEAIAARETAELRAESLQMGASLVRLLPALQIAAPPLDPIAYTAAFAAAAAGLGLDREAGLAAYLWTWVENQVLVAVKSVALGQSAGQRVLFGLHDSVARAVDAAAALAQRPFDEWGGATVGAVLMSMRHETQYSRLFRS